MAGDGLVAVETASRPGSLHSSPGGRCTGARCWPGSPWSGPAWKTSTCSSPTRAGADAGKEHVMATVTRADRPRRRGISRRACGTSRTGLASGPVRAAVVLAQPAERDSSPLSSRSCSSSSMGALFRGRDEPVLLRAVRPAVLRAHDRRAVRAGLVLRPARGRPGHPAAGRASSSGSGLRRCPRGATSRPAGPLRAGQRDRRRAHRRRWPALRRAVPDHWPADRADAGARRGRFCALGVAVASLIAQRRGRPGGGPAHPVPAAVPVRHLPADPLRALNQVAGGLPVRPFNEALTGPFAQHAGADWRAWRCSPPGARPARWSRSAASAGIRGPSRRPRRQDR